MKRILLPSSYAGETSWILTGSDFHHLIRVSRHKKGDRLKGSDVNGGHYNITICGITGSSAMLRIDKNVERTEECIQIRLVQAISKGKTMDLIIRQATESGVVGIIPVFTKNSVVKLESEKGFENKLQRWNKIVKEAVVQSGSPIIPLINTPDQVENIEFEKNALVLFFHQESKGSVPLHVALINDYKIIYILIGPEGGFTDDEVVGFIKKNYIPIYLGGNVLRVETAALYAIASIKTILLEKEIWRKT